MLSKHAHGQPMVSVIMIFLDGEQFIRQAIDSVLRQTHRDWELLLVDDGSQDGSSEVALRYVAQHPQRIRYLEHPGHTNRGTGPTRNLGLRHARGDYIGFLDCDDIWLPRKLQMQLRLFARWPDADLVCGPTKWWYGWTGRPRDARRDALREIGIPPDRLFRPPTLIESFLRREIRMPAMCSALVRRETVDAVGGFEENFRALYEDQAFLVKAFQQGHVVATRDCCDWYRQHPTSLCARSDRDGPPHWVEANPARQAFLRWVHGYLSQGGTCG